MRFTILNLLFEIHIVDIVIFFVSIMYNCLFLLRIIDSAYLEKCFQFFGIVSQFTFDFLKNLNYYFNSVNFDN